MNSPPYLSRGIDYLGDLGAKLRDLQGYRTLAHELIQNADDAANATSMSFDVTDEAFIVDNDGVFRDCGQVDASECPWKADGNHNHRCDFHRFRYVAAGDKRGEANTTGAFGIGFIAVYQITDKPEVLSAGRHWILHEDQPAERRIEVCPGCVNCTGTTLPGTRFILPWVRDVHSSLRKALGAEPVSEDGPIRLLDELKHSLPIAMLFLNRLRSMVVKSAGETLCSFQRLDQGDSLILSDGNPENDRIWYLVRGDFSEHAVDLRAQHPNRLEDKQSTQVTIAIPEIDLRLGLLCACLPTEQVTRLPFHINADFFPTSDRKRVILESDFQSAWNRCALLAAARAVGTALNRLPTLLGPKRFWNTLETLRVVAEATDKDHGEKALASFWKTVAPHLKTAQVIYTTQGEWTSCDASFLLLQREEAAAIPIVEAMGISLVHEDLRPYQSLLRSESLEVQLLDISKICDALTAHGMTRRLDPDAWPSFLAGNSVREGLWEEITLLLERQQKMLNAKARDEQRLKYIAIAPGRDGALWPCGQVFVADESTIKLFHSLGAEVPFLANEPAFKSLAGLCAKFDASAAIQALQTMGKERLLTSWNQKKLVPNNLFTWFEHRRQEILTNPTTKHDLAELLIFPCSGGLRRLAQLALPGNFEDPLGLAELVDLSALGGRQEFLRDLGMPELDFVTYAKSRLPAALSDPEVQVNKRRAAVALIASHLGEIKDDQEIQSALGAAPVVECADGQFRNAQDCYFPTSVVRETLGESVWLVVIPAAHESAFRDLYEWLGVADAPRERHLLSRVSLITSQPYSLIAAQIIQRIISYLGSQVAEKVLPPQLQELQQVAWLPAKGRADCWYRPRELFASYQAYLFETQALFLDVPFNIQNASRPFLESLGVEITPTATLVVKHLMHCAANRIPVNREVYRFLNDNVNDLSINTLKDKQCLYIGGEYLAPDRVFWGEHPFGRYRKRLSEELRQFSMVFGRIGVRDTPDHRDARKVLIEISVQFGATNTHLDDESHAVLMACWQLFEGALSDGVSLDSLRGVRCIPDVRRILNPPEWMFFENRAGLAGKFGEFLVHNVIARPLGASVAMAAAGVRSLGSAVEIQLLECTDPVSDSEVRGRILGRRNELGRVIWAQAGGVRAEAALSAISDIECQSTTTLLIRYTLNVFDRIFNSNPETIPALYQNTERRLLFVRKDGDVSWAAIARELAIALFPDEDPGRIAAGLKEVLAASSAGEAASALNELGFAGLDTSVPAPPTSEVTAVTLGANTLPPESVAPGPSSGQPPLTPGEAIKQLLGADTPTPTPPQPSAILPERPEGSIPKPPTRRTSKLRSYVVDGDVESSTEHDPEVRERRTMTEEAGIQKVKTFEESAGRFPKVMPPFNPGYDIESKDASGAILRYIEVKSISGDWGLDGVEVTHVQFNAARERPDTHWLYVVERANRDDAKVHRIHNPAGRVTRYMFDDGWRGAAESDLDSQ